MTDNRGHSANNVKSWWPTEKYDTGASAWADVNAIPAAGIDEITESRIGTSEMVLMADGTLGRVTPDNRYNFEQIRFLFHKATTSANLLTEFKTYQNDHTGIRITTHTGEKFEGYIDSVTRVWHFKPSGNGEEEFSIEVVFQQFDVSGDGTIG